MAKVYKVNFSPSTGAEAIYELKNVLTGSGWTVISSSDGNTVSNSDLITSPTTMTNQNAWFVIQEPIGSNRQWCFQRTTSNLSWRVKISVNAGFSGGNASEAIVPSATDEGIIWGSGTDASPTGATLFDADNTYRFHIIADDTGIGPTGNKTWGFWAFSNIAGDTSNSGLGTIICQEPLAVGSYPALTGSRAATTSGEADPAVYGIGFNSSGYYLFIYTSYLLGHSIETNNTFKMFYNYQNNSGSLTYADDVLNGTYSVPNLGTHPNTNQDITVPIFFGRQGSGTGATHGRTTFVGWKGISHFLRRKMVLRATGDTINLSDNAYIYWGDLLIPWPNGVTPSL